MGQEAKHKKKKEKIIANNSINPRGVELSSNNNSSEHLHNIIS